MTKILYIGDVHSTPEDMDDCTSLLAFVLDTAKASKPDYIVFLGDQFHRFDTLSIRLLDFWREWLLTAIDTAPVYLLVGNHDRVGPKDTTNRNSMSLFGGVWKSGCLDCVKVVEKPTYIEPGILAVPYMSTTEFVNLFSGDKKWPAKTVLCHQEFDGGQYDNGFYIKDGIPTAILEGCQVISGHIHKPSEFANVWYPGAPRWQTLTDANVDRAIWLVEHAEDGSIVGRTQFNTHGIVPKIWRYEDKPLAPLNLDSFLDGNKPGDMPVVFVHGDAERVRLRCIEFRNRGCTTRSCVTNEVVGSVKESLGIQKAFSEFFCGYTPKHGTDPQVLGDLSRERLGE